MKQFIDKSALVAEIERLISNGQVKLQESQENNDDENYVVWAEHIATCIKVLSLINTLEVKEVELENEIQNIHKHFHDYYGIINSDTGEFAKVEDMLQIAKHFFELGLKSKGE